MKDAYIYDGSEWQSLKGPPGPSEPSADAGNLLTVGSDGLLMLKGNTTFGGAWQPLSNNDMAVEGQWTRTGRSVTLLIQVNVDAVPADQVVYFSISGLPFSPPEFWDEATSAQSAQFAAPVVHWAAGVIGWAGLDAFGIISVSLKAGSSDIGAGACVIVLHYLTDDAGLG